ncbi:MAG TPA: HAD-IA family hydrolase [Chloroflexia bacterium]|jgi:putative hydrolase of the HAD superfamily
MLRGVLFDMGGTLLEYKREDWSSLDVQLNSDLHTYIASRGHADKLPPLDEFLEVFNVRTRTNWEQAARTQKSFNLLHLLDELFSEHGISEKPTGDYLLPWYKGVSDITYIRPDVKPTLERLRDSGLKLGLVSNTAWPSTIHDPDLERFGLLDLLECRIYSCEFGWEKPAPPIFRAALDCIGLGAEETVFVGDFRRYDIAGAHAAGMKGVWKRIEGRPADVDDPTVVPDATITTIGELPEALSMLYGFGI